MGDKHSCALFTNGSVKCWGESSVLGLGYSTSDGGFGDGYLETGDTLPFLQFPTGRHATMIEAGKSHTCAVMDNNDLTAGVITPRDNSVLAIQTTEETLPAKSEATSQSQACPLAALSTAWLWAGTTPVLCGITTAYPAGVEMTTDNSD